MKRLLLPLMLILLLLGCSNPPQGEVFPSTQATQPTELTEPPGLYEKNSALETDTGGALRFFRPEQEDCYAMDIMDGDVLLFSGVERTVLTRFTGDTLYPIAQAKLDCLVFPEDASFCAGPKGVTYYDETARAVVFLDNDLKEVSRIPMPEDAVGSPVLSANRLRLFYCTADAVRVWDLETGLDRLLKQISYPYQVVAGTLFSDTVVQCILEDEGGTYTAFLSAETGELAADLCQGYQVTGAGSHYYASADSGILTQWLYGTADSEPKMLTPADPFAGVWFLEETQGAVACSFMETEVKLDYYDLAERHRMAALTLSPEFTPWQMEPAGEKIFILGRDGETTVLYLWDVKKSAVTDAAIYSGPWYTADAPDEAGLAACGERAARMGQQYGLEIRVGLSGDDVQPWDYDMEPEYQVPVIHQALDTLEQILATYPQGFFDTMDEDIKICLVRSLQGSVQSGSLDSANGIQFWENGSAYVVLTPGDALERTVYHELYHLIDNHVLSVCNAFYDWERLNPQGFAYDLDYWKNLERDPEQYLEPETRAFIDTYSMSYPKEDRARMMEYAATAGNAEFFQSPVMQEKLRTLCQGIREAFKLRQYPNVLPWEQYLQEPLL